MVDCDRREVQQAIPSLIRFIHYSLNPTSGIIQITFKGTVSVISSDPRCKDGNA